MAILYTTSGEMIEVKPKGKEFTVEEVQNLVGGYFEPIYLSQGRCLCFDEDGRMKGRPENKAATARLQLEANRKVVTLVGDCLLTEPGEVS